MKTKKEVVQHADIAIIRERLCDSGLEVKALSKEAIETQMKTLNADGLWEDIDYDQLPKGWYWVSIEHVKRLEQMARAYRSPNHLLYGNEMLYQCILLAYDAWCDTLRGEEAGNHVIRVRIPRSLGITMVLMADCLSDDQKEAGYRYLERAWTGTWGWTGENLVWRAQGSIYHAALKSDFHFLEEVLERVSSEALVLAEPGADGIQGDFSFHQHGSQLYSGGYGMNFMADIARMALLLIDTQFSFSKEKIGIISGLILDGSRWMVRKKVFDYGAMGRFITRPDMYERAGGMIESCQVMARVDPARVTEFESFLEQLEDKSNVSLEGNRHFWQSDFMVHHRKAYYASVRMYSTRTVGNERCTGEGLQSYHLPDGMTTVIQHGKEFGGDGKNLLLAWNWRHLPGITCEHNSDPLPTDRDVPRYQLYRGATSFVGGVSNGHYGAVGYDFLKYADPDDVETPAVRARKSVFFFDDEFVCLGAAIKGYRDHSILTTVNQCLLNGSVTVHTQTDKRDFDGGLVQKLEMSGWILHDGIGYYFPDKTNLVLKTTKACQKLDFVTRETLGHTQDRYEAEIFNLFIDHSVKPISESYCYLIRPGANEESLTGSTVVRVLENSNHMQGVRHDDLKVSEIIFYVPGDIWVHSGLRISVNEPCMVMVCEKGHQAEVSVANPEGTALTVEVRLNDLIEVFDLPGGREGGKSVVKMVDF